MLIVADRLKITLKQVLEMSEAEYNTWLGYLMLEQDEYNRNRKDDKGLKHSVPELIKLVGPERALCTMVNFCNRPYMTGRGLSKFRAKQLFLRQAKKAQQQKKEQGK